MIGPTGISGSGVNIYTDTGSPSFNNGNVGDFYINTSTGDLYGPKTLSGWSQSPVISNCNTLVSSSCGSSSISLCDTIYDFLKNNLGTIIFILVLVIILYILI